MQKCKIVYKQNIIQILVESKNKNPVCSAVL